MEIDKEIRLADEYFQKGDLQQAESVCREILTTQPENAGAIHLLGIIHYELGEYDLAMSFLKEALQLNSSNAGLYYDIGNILLDQGKFDDASTYYQKAIECNPNHADAYNNLGNALHEMGELDEAISCYQKALQISPELPYLNNNLGLVLQDKGRLDEAITYYQRAIELNPEYADAFYNLGNVLRGRRQFDKAIIFYQKALQFDPDFVEAYYNMGIAFGETGQLDEAATYYQKALQLNPKFANIYNNLGNIMEEKHEVEKAIEYYLFALTLQPDFADAYVNLGNVFTRSSKFDEAENYYRRALEIKPDCSVCHSNLLLSMLYNSRYDPQIVFSEHLKFAEQFEKSFRFIPIVHKNKRKINGRLKIGYISPDFRKHSVASFIEPVLTIHDREHFEVFCYSDVLRQDEVTALIRGHADLWRDIASMSDEEVSEVIREDEIDILFDLAGHTAHNRMLLFARKPAPVQVSWIGYPATTGLSTMDYKIVDNYTDPPGMTERFYTEKLIRMPESFLCYLPDMDSPEVGVLPAISSGQITFGSFNNLAKVSPEVIKIWTKILKTIPSSRLIMKAKSLSDRSTRDYVMELFTRWDIEPERIDLISWQQSMREHLDVYNHIDIGLDTFPYNGTTTTCEALWMGVPVITLAGNTHASRVGVSLLSNVGIPELIAETYDEYVDIAVNLAANIKRLKTLRGSLRDMIAGSPLTDAKRFIANLENSYRSVWEKWYKSSQNV